MSSQLGGDGGTITSLLREARCGDARAREAVFAEAYDHLRRIAAAHLRSTGHERILQATALVNEAYARLSDAETLAAQDRRDLFRAFSRAIHHELVDHIRAENAQKRGGGRGRELLTDIPVDGGTMTLDLIELRAALEELERHDPEGAEVVRLRFFAGKSLRQTADILGCTLAAVRGHWSYAQVWLVDRLGRAASDGPETPETPH